MCGCRKFSDIASVKVVGDPIGGRRRRANVPMRDADGDGKCQEENGKWIPCPPGTPVGSVIDGAGKAIRKIGEAAKPAKKPAKPAKQVAPDSIESIIEANRKKAADKAKRIADEAERGVDETKRSLARDVRELVDELETADPRDARRIRREITENLAEILSHQFTGLDDRQYEVQIDEITFPDSGQVYFSGGFVNKNGSRVGDFERQLDFYQGQVFHERMVLTKQSQGSGIGTAFNARNEVLYREMGMNAIFVGALSTPGSGGGPAYTGSTHWPKNGYDWADERAKMEFLSTVGSAIRKHRSSAKPDGSSELFASKEEFENLVKLYERSRMEAFNRKDRITAGDLLNWSGAEKHFQKAFATIDYRREI